MSGQQVADVLTGPLDLPKDPAQAEGELREAIRMYPFGGPSGAKFHDEASMLYRCVGAGGRRPWHKSRARSRPGRSSSKAQEL